MTEMGAKSSCSDDSVRSDGATNVNDTMTLLSKDRLLYNFMVDTLDAGNNCPGTNNTLISFPVDCGSYFRLRYYRAIESTCGHKTKINDTGSGFEYGHCLTYRLYTRLGADSVCAQYTDRITVTHMCSLFGFMKKWLQEGGVFMDNAIMNDTDTTVQKEWMFSDNDCYFYRYNIEKLAYSICEVNSMVYDSKPKWIHYFIDCITLHFMTEMGARGSCYNKSARSDGGITVYGTMTLLSKDRMFYAFMVDTLDAGNICQARNDTVPFPTFECDWYIDIVKYYNPESTCSNKTPKTDSGMESYRSCLRYRFLKSLGADSVCQVPLFTNCYEYYAVLQSLIPTCICVIGLIGNLLSICMFCSGAIETPAAYQLQWLAVVDITFILTWWVVFVLPDTVMYFTIHRSLYGDWIKPILYVCLRPLSYVARSCTVWLTVLIGLYRYMAVCTPYSNVFSHCTQHGHKYVVLVVILSFLYNSPHFIEYYLIPVEFYDYSWLLVTTTGFLSKRFYDVYATYVHPTFVVGVPCLVLIFVTVSILVKLRKRKKKKRNMQTSQASQTSITVMLVTILITFVLCQIPYFVWYGFGGVNDDLSGWYEKNIDCRDFMFYMHWLVNLGLLLNSSANGFIYFFLNKTFREALFARCQ